MESSGVNGPRNKLANLFGSFSGLQFIESKDEDKQPVKSVAMIRKSDGKIMESFLKA